MIRDQKKYNIVKHLRQQDLVINHLDLIAFQK